MRLLTTAQAIKRTGLPRSTLYWLRKKGRFPTPVHVGLLAMYRVADVERWLRDNCGGVKAMSA